MSKFSYNVSLINVAASGTSVGRVAIFRAGRRDSLSFNIVMSKGFPAGLFFAAILADFRLRAGRVFPFMAGRRFPTEPFCSASFAFFRILAGRVYPFVAKGISLRLAAGRTGPWLRTGSVLPSMLAEIALCCAAGAADLGSGAGRLLPVMPVLAADRISGDREGLVLMPAGAAVIGDEEVIELRFARPRRDQASRHDQNCLVMVKLAEASVPLLRYRQDVKAGGIHQHREFKEFTVLRQLQEIEVSNSDSSIVLEYSLIHTFPPTAYFSLATLLIFK